MLVAHQRALCIEIFKPIKNQNPTFMQSILTSRTSKHPSWNHNNLNHFRPNQVTFGSKSLKAMGPQILNYLPSELKSADNLNGFKQMIKHAILLEILKKKVGLSGTALQWVQSYISNRCQCVQIKGKLSERTELEYGVPQGSCLGPILFLIYASLLFDVIAKHLPNAHGYADDHQIYLSFKPTDQVSQEDALQSIQACISDVRKWMLANKLKINDGKTEFMIIGSKHNLSRLNITSIKIGDTEIKPVTSLRNLGAMIDENLSMEHQITKTCSTAFYHIRNIRHIRKYLDVKSTETMVHAFITNKLDYCNSLLYGLPDCQIQKLQRVQNAAARIITGIKKYDHITPALKELHWLPVQQRIEFKILLLPYKALNNMAQSYITSMFTMQGQERYSLRSNASLQLKIPRTKYKTCGDRAFPVAAATLWNRLPYNILKLLSHSPFAASVHFN